MGLLILAGYAGQGDPSRSIVLWVLLVAALGLTYWECRERGYRLKVLLWWMSFVAITHVLGYIILRLLARPSQRA